MKRRELMRHLEQHGGVLDREGANHSIYRNPANSSCGGTAASGNQAYHHENDLRPVGDCASDVGKLK